MEIKINTEIRSYKETVYFGLTARQLICSRQWVVAGWRVNSGQRSAGISSRVLRSTGKISRK